MANPSGLSSRSAKKKEQQEKFFLVGLGASAGGVQALKTFFARMPAGNNMAFAVIMHLSEHYESQLHTILQAETLMPVIQVQEPVLVEPDHVYVIPPGKQLELVDGIITLGPLQRADHTNLAIDHFFRTLAKAYGGRGVGIVLSGTGSDGSMGIKMIKEHNGITIVQRPDEAEHREMPSNALMTGVVDLVLGVAEMPARLIALRDGNQVLNISDKELKAKEEDADKFTVLQEILRLIRIRTGADFSHYKPPTLFRRIGRQMQLRGLENIQDYLHLLQEDQSELEPLQKSLLINVTEFFRDKDAFDFLESRVIPALFEGKGPQDNVRIWVAACATGEEAYSIAILVAEYLDRLPEPPEVQIFASDLSKEIVSSAREGHFPKGIALDVSEERLKRFFVEEEKSYRIRNEVREMILFTPHNILGDPPFLRLDLISCRNFLIYLNRAAQEKVLRLFHFALLPEGYLFLGSSESADNKTMLFSAVEKKHAVYTPSSSVPSGHDPLVLPASPSWQLRAPELKLSLSEPSFSAGELHYRLIENYAPPSVLVDENFEIVHLSEHAARYFRFSGGKPSHQLLNALIPDLRSDLRTLLFTVRQQQQKAEARNLRASIGQEEEQLSLKVIPVLDIPALRGFLLILFEKALPAVHPTEPQIDDFQGKAVMQEITRRLEEELIETKSRLRVTIEQYETLVEEMKASNEELYAVNEEMRSTTEELETSREELQSVNEELKAVNHDLKEKAEELIRSNADLRNLMASTDIGAIFLDRSLNIQLFTPAAQSLFNIIVSDLGRPISHITNQLQYQELSDDAKGVLQKLQTREREVKSNSGRCYIARLLPYRTEENRVDGVVLTFLDITERKRAEDAMTEERLRMAIDTADIGIWEYHLKEKRIKWSTSLYKIQDVARGAFRGTMEHWAEFIHPDDRELFIQKMQAGFDREEEFSVEVRSRPREKGLVWLFFKARVVRSETGEPVMIRGATIDITDRKRVEEVLLESNRRMNEFLAILSHELRTPLTPISAALELLQRKPPEEQVQKLQAIMGRQVKHLEHLVTELLDVARIAQGKIDLHRQRLVLQEAVRMAVEINRHEIDTREHQLAVDMPDEPVYLYADPDRMVQILHNLLNNAAKYTPKGGRVQLMIHTDGQEVIIRVKDNGKGIPVDQLGEIFELFFQVDPAKKERAAGLGIGLRLVRQLTELHGGSVEAKSDGPGSGSEFVVRLPLAQEDQPAPEEKPAPDSAESGKNQRVLLVDDNTDIANITADLLRMEGHEVTVFDSGAAALSAVKDLQPTAAVIDIGLPDMDGYELGARLRSELPEILMIAYSGWGQDGDKQRSLEAGFDIHVVKPAEAGQLSELIRRGRE